MSGDGVRVQACVGAAVRVEVTIARIGVTNAEAP